MCTSTTDRAFPGLLAGATAVCIVCYVIPVALHLKIYFSPGAYKGLHSQQGAGGTLSAPLLQVTNYDSMSHCVLFSFKHACALAPTWRLLLASVSMVSWYLQEGPCPCGGCEEGKEGGPCSCRQQEPDYRRVGEVGSHNACMGGHTLGGPAGQQYQAHSAWRQARWRKLRESLEEVVLPVAVVLLGVGFSVAALWVSLSQALWPKPS